MKKIYLDYAATTSVDPRVFAAMRPYFSDKFANPGSAHSFGQEAFRAVLNARKTVANAFGCAPEGVIFTASASEANNLAIRGVISRYRIEDYRLSSISAPHVITTAIEHDSVLEVCRALEAEGLAEVTYVGVDREGIVDPADIAKALRPETVLVSVMYANNEIGTIQPIAEIAQIVRDFRFRLSSIPYPIFHTDAVQAVQYLDCDMERLGVDLMTVSSHKIYGPKGAAALLVRQPLTTNYHLLTPIIWGGGQERGLRSGTENVPAIVGFGKAVELALANREKEYRRQTALRDRFIEKLLALAGGIALNGSTASRLPNNVNVSFPGIPSDVMVTMLDRAGIAVSSGSACAAHASKPSHALASLGISEERRRSAVRISLGRGTRARDLDYAIEIVAKCLNAI